MIGLGYLAIAALCIWGSFQVGKKIKKGTIVFLVYWGLIAVIPVWFFVGHKFYPSYSKFHELCETESISASVKDKTLEVVDSDAWIVKNRLKESGFKQIDSQGKVVGEYATYYYYPYSSEAILMGGASGAAPRESCPKKADA